MADTDPAVGRGERKTYPTEGFVVFAGCLLLGFGFFGGAGILAAGPALPLAVGTWRWGLRGCLAMIPVAGLIFGGCLAIILRGIHE